MDIFLLRKGQPRHWNRNVSGTTCQADEVISFTRTRSYSTGADVILSTRVPIVRQSQLCARPSYCKQTLLKQAKWSNVRVLWQLFAIVLFSRNLYSELSLWYASYLFLCNQYDTRAYWWLHHRMRREQN